MVAKELPTLYLFIDESGDFGFHTSGSRYYTISALVRVRPFSAIPELTDLKHDLWENQVELEYFHACEDKPDVRDRVFGIIGKITDEIRVHAIIAEKRRTNPTLQKDKARFYKTLLDILINYLLNIAYSGYGKVVIVIDRLPTMDKSKSNSRKLLEKAIKLTVGQWSKRTGIPYTLLHCASMSDCNLQLVDYINWAIARKWEKGDATSHALVARCIRSEYEVFRRGKTTYY